MLTFYKQASDKGGTREPFPEGSVKVEGPWQVHVIGALQLRSISRIYGALNSYTLPVWFRVPGYKLYSWVFGVHLDECDPEDLREYRSMSEFFMRRLKPGVRPIADAAIVSVVPLVRVSLERSDLIKNPTTTGWNRSRPPTVKLSISV